MAGATVGRQARLSWETLSGEFSGKRLFGAFWEDFKEQISTDPPNYKSIISIVSQVKEYLKNLYKKQTSHSKYIDEVLDIEFLEMRIKNGTYSNTNFQELTIFLLEELRKLDSASHDSENKELKKKLESVKNQQEFIDIISECIQYIVTRLEFLTEFMTEVRKCNLKE